MKTYAAHYGPETVDADGSIQVSSLRLNDDMYYDADRGDSTYDLDNAKSDTTYMPYNVWNEAEDTYETYDTLEDCTIPLHARKTHMYFNVPHYGDNGVLCGLTQIFFWS